MIVRQPLKVGDVVTIKLINGDEIIAGVVDQDNNFKRPFVVAMAHEGFGLMPYILTMENQETLHISPDKIFAIGTTIPEVKKAYIHQTSGLLVP
jgi:hypothetical protein